MPISPEKESLGPALDRQKSIYVAGMSGIKPLIPVDFTGLEAAAKSRLSNEAFAYIAGAAGKESTNTENRSAFDRWRILPRMLRDVSQRSTSISILGQEIPVPLFTAPIGVLELAHKQADLAVARATASLGIPMIFSNQASYSMESCAALMKDSPRIFQLYWSKSNELVKSLVTRAEQCGCQAIVVTLDTTMLGWRNRDLNLGYLPFMQGRGIAQYIKDPVFNNMLDELNGKKNEALQPRMTIKLLENIFHLMKNYPGGLWKNIKSKRPLNAVRKFIDVYSRPNLTWEDLSFLRDQTKLPIILKGILHPKDAHLAVQSGMDGIIVSNHGGRQVDGAVSAIEMLPEISTVVDKSIPILFDSGIRSGADIFKALALGATAVGIGRPYVYGLALAGEVGVKEVLLNLWSEFELTMGLAGCNSISEISSDCLKEN